MKLNSTKTSFGQHGTFPLRYSWMAKGVEALNELATIFTDTEKAMRRLGVGSNMAHAIQYWMRAAGVAQFSDGIGSVTDLGNALLGESGDPFLEDEATVWILHWLITSNTELATGFYWFFNVFSAPMFDEDEALFALGDFVTHELKSTRSVNTLKSDVSTLMRMYAPINAKGDEHLDSPLRLLGLVERGSAGSHRSPRNARLNLPTIALHFALAHRFEAAPETKMLPVKSLLHCTDGYGSPGSAFRLSEDGLMAGLERVMTAFPGTYLLRETAGIHQLYRIDLPSSLEIVKRYYQQVTA